MKPQTSSGMTPFEQRAADARFRMVKERHQKSLETAISEKKIDPLMIPISKFIAQTKEYFTTSTCSGRITLMDLDEKEMKREGAFFRKWHRTVTFKEVWEGICDESNAGNLWFKQDGLVMLLGTHSMENAKHVLDVVHNLGMKRIGINHFEPGKVHIEIFGTHHMSVPVKSGKKVLVEKEYVKELVKLANKKWKMNDATLKKLCATLKKELA
ncbi:MAG: hypothetical protein IPJ89_05685 [Candidatus Iainarchaeum archaeon]|uniref:tRNA(Phe) 7-((3-amino-3-carboxypropyl)-4-demethylwyosine(37)-N(4))-methyltransferase n=1 Tax=Candidatus Iainarchaeum sp. TaxID=3101447 RepID=A0A7T9DJQ7_9ARCH|nr:MAG: hypothetical protein IPJ89_05685 [Candidatus Diapherotrites archaeon]